MGCGRGAAASDRAGDAVAVFLTGDGGFAELDKQIAENKTYLERADRNLKHAQNQKEYETAMRETDSIQKQIGAFEKAYTGNARPTQPLNGRAVRIDSSGKRARISRRRLVAKSSAKGVLLSPVGWHCDRAPGC